LSVKGFFGHNDLPQSKATPLRDVYTDLARITAAEGRPEWLIIGGIFGDEIPREPRSRLLPICPSVKSNELPTYTINRKPEATTKYVTCAAFFLDNFDIEFKTHSLPHIVSARMFKVKSTPKPYGKNRSPRSSDQVNFKYARIKFEGGLEGKVKYFGSRGEMGVYVGKVSRAPYSVNMFNTKSGRYFLFMSFSSKDGWQQVGAGLFEKSRGSYSKRKTMFTIGRGASPYLYTWPYDYNTTHSWRRVNVQSTFRVKVLGARRSIDTRSLSQPKSQRKPKQYREYWTNFRWKVPDLSKLKR
jgi:hypothetical protein